MPDPHKVASSVSNIFGTITKSKKKRKKKKRRGVRRGHPIHRAPVVEEGHERKTFTQETQTDFGDFGPLLLALPKSIQDTRKTILAQVHAQQTTSKRSIQTRVQSRGVGRGGYSGRRRGGERGSKARAQQQKTLKQVRRQQLKYRKRVLSSATGTSTTGSTGSGPVPPLNLPDSDSEVQSIFDSARESLDASESDVAPESEIHIMRPHVKIQDSSDSEGAGDTPSSPQQRKFSKMPPLDLIKVCSIVSPRSYASSQTTRTTVTGTTSSPGRSKKSDSMRPSSKTAFNALSARSVRSNLSSTRSLLSISSLGEAIDLAEAKDNQSFSSIRSESSGSEHGADEEDGSKK